MCLQYSLICASRDLDIRTWSECTRSSAHCKGLRNWKATRRTDGHGLLGSKFLLESCMGFSKSFGRPCSCRTSASNDTAFGVKGVLASDSHEQIC